MCKNLTQFPNALKAQVIPVTNEKYSSPSIEVEVSSYVDFRGIERNVYEYFGFIASYRLMPS